MDPTVRLEWFGSLPSKMVRKAIPLFTDPANGADYQLHLAFTRMDGLHTYSHSAVMPPRTVENEKDLIPHYYAHTQVRIVTWPDIVVPLGKLFANSSGHSDWTGYEVFVSRKMDLWIIRCR